MKTRKDKFILNNLEIRIGITITLGLIITHLIGLSGFPVQSVAVSTTIIMCLYRKHTGSRRATLHRVIGVLSGGTAGMLLVFIDNYLQIPLLFYILIGLGIMLNFIICKLAHMPPIQGRVSGISLLLVALVFEEGSRYQYALERLISTLLGAVIALLASLAWVKISKWQKARRV